MGIAPVTGPEASLPLFEYMLGGRHPWGTRLFADGRVEAYSDEEIKFVDGDFRAKPVPLAWRPRARLPASDVERLKVSLARSGFFDLPATFAGRAARDGRTIVWSARMDGRSHSVTTRDQTQAQHAILEQLRSEFEALVAAALNRDEDATKGE